MQDHVRQEILRGFLVVLKPFARILLRFGIGYKEFEEIAKLAFVDVASSDFGIRGRPTNISRVAVMTGLTRKEVRRVRDDLANESDLVALSNTPLLRLIHNWYTNEDFLDSSGQPETLPFLSDEADPGKSSFTELVRRTGGDIPPGALRTELKRVGAVEEQPNGSLKIVKRTYLPEHAHENLVETLVHLVYPVAMTVAHNTNPQLKKGDSWPQKTAFSSRIRDTDTLRLRRIARDRVDGLAAAMDDIFASYESLRSTEESDELASVYIGSFYFEGPADMPYREKVYEERDEVIDSQ